MKNDMHINLRIPKRLYDDLSKLSIKFFGKEQISRLVRLVLEKYSSEVLQNESFDTDFKYKL